MAEQTREIPRAVTGEDGKSHWSTGQLTLVPVDPSEHGGGEFAGHAFGKQEVAYVEFPPDFTCDFHQGIKSVIFVMKGRVLFELNGGGPKTLEPGDAAMFDDVDGGGHKATALDGEGVVLAVAGMTV